MGPDLQRALLLMQHHRPADAERLLRDALSGDPEDGHAHALLSLCLSDQRKWHAAAKEALAAIGADPEDALGHYARGYALLHLGWLREAEAAVRAALELARAPAFFGLLGDIHLAQKKWREAREAATAGLEVDATDVWCANVRARADLKLGDAAAADGTLRTVLALEPESAVTHANLGWTALQRGEHAAALVHFREALRQDPRLGLAREGLAQALRSRVPAYRMALSLGRLARRPRWRLAFTLAGGAAVCVALVLRLPLSLAVLAAVFLPYATVVYGHFAADLALHLDPQARKLLPPEEVAASRAFLAAAVGGTGTLAVALLLRSPAGFGLFLATLAAIPPLYLRALVPRGRIRTRLGALAGCTAALAATALVTALLLPRAEAASAVFLASVLTFCFSVPLVHPRIAQGIRAAADRG